MKKYLPISISLVALLIMAVALLFFESDLLWKLQERNLFHYPPSCSFVIIHLKHKDYRKAYQAASILAKELREALKNRVRGPEEPAVNRISNYFIVNVHVRFEKSISATKVKAFILEKVQMIKSIPELSQTNAEIDVDPY